MRIGISCYPTYGGSGIVATELAKSLAARGHDVHVLSADTPFRFGAYQPGLTFHRVSTPAYPLFRETQYVIALATALVHVSREFRLDIMHAHYAVPHATAAYLAKQILLSAAADHVPHSKRATAVDQVEAMAALGFDRFAVAGHDRGGRVAYRMALDHPDRVQRLAVLELARRLLQRQPGAGQHVADERRRVAAPGHARQGPGRRQAREAEEAQEGEVGAAAPARTGTDPVLAVRIAPRWI